MRPAGRHSHGLRRLAVYEAVRGSYDTAKAVIDRRCGRVAGKRQLEQLVQAAAVDIDGFYARRVPVPCTSEVLLVLSADGKGIVMRLEGLRSATGKAAAQLNPDGSRHQSDQGMLKVGHEILASWFAEDHGHARRRSDDKAPATPRLRRRWGQLGRPASP